MDRTGDRKSTVSVILTRNPVSPKCSDETGFLTL
jgi:hypothetical protein